MTYNFRISTNYSHLEIIKKYNIRFVLCVCAQSCLTLCDPMDSSVHGIFQARILEWVSIFYSREFPDPGIEPTSFTSPKLAGWFFTTAPCRKPNIRLRVIKSKCWSIKAHNALSSWFYYLYILNELTLNLY